MGLPKHELFKEPELTEEQKERLEKLYKTMKWKLCKSPGKRYWMKHNAIMTKEERKKENREFRRMCRICRKSGIFKIPLPKNHENMSDREIVIQYRKEKKEEPEKIRKGEIIIGCINAPTAEEREQLYQSIITGKPMIEPTTWEKLKEKWRTFYYGI